MTLDTIYQGLWIFLIYSFLGWCAEGVFQGVSQGRFVNRGFLNGPVCPIYGFAVLAVLPCLQYLKDNPFLIFFCSAAICTILVFLTGLLLEKLFRRKWWDFSDRPLNICGYVCLKYSILWGFTGLFCVQVIQPYVYSFIDIVPQPFGFAALGAFSLGLLMDIVITVIAAFKLEKLFGAHCEKHECGESDSPELSAKVEELNFSLNESDNAEPNTVQKRILNAFPSLSNQAEKTCGRARRFMNNELDLSSIMMLPPDTLKSIYQNAPLVLYRDTVATVVDVLEARDEYTAGHSRRVSELTHRFCRALNLPPLETEMLDMAATVHDLGKVGIPDAILNKHDKLTDEEWQQMRRHPVIGADIIMRAGRLDHVAEIVRHHHERWNGMGYPDGLAGNDIPKGAQIIAICDAVDSMMLARVYRGAFTTEQCHEEVSSSSGTMFNPRLADTFLENWDYIVGVLYVQSDD